jgi:haloalkane dehalogenase
MEALVRQYLAWQEFRPSAVETFNKFRSEAGEEMVLQRNMFVEDVLPGFVLRTLSQEEMSPYHRPFSVPADRWPTLTWPCENSDRRRANGRSCHRRFLRRLAGKLARTEVVYQRGARSHRNRSPSRVLSPNQSEVTVRGTHFLQITPVNECFSRYLTSLEIKGTGQFS